MTVTAPPRPPRPSDPSIGRSWRRSSRRCSRRRGSARAVGGGSTRRPWRWWRWSASRSRPFSSARHSRTPLRPRSRRGRAFPPQRQAKSRSSAPSSLLWPRGPFGLYVVNADGSGKRKLTRDVQHPAWSPEGERSLSSSTRRQRDLRHQRRRKRQAETHEQRGGGRCSCLVARRAQDRLLPRPELPPAGCLRHERRRERTAEAGGPRVAQPSLPGRPTGGSPS